MTMSTDTGHRREAPIGLHYNRALIPGTSLICLIGAAGAGKSSWASTWQPAQVLELDHFREMVSDDAGSQEATRDAVTAMQAVLEARMSRLLLTVVDATNTEARVRAGLIATARRHDVPAVALALPPDNDLST